MSTLAELLAATPAPPAGDALLPTFATMHVARQAILDRLTGPIPLVTEEDRLLAALLVERQVAWSEALAAARDEVGEHRLNARKLRGYHAMLAAGR